MYGYTGKYTGKSRSCSVMWCKRPHPWHVTLRMVMISSHVIIQELYQLGPQPLVRSAMPDWSRGRGLMEDRRLGTGLINPLYNTLILYAANKLSGKLKSRCGSPQRSDRHQCHSVRLQPAALFHDPITPQATEQLPPPGAHGNQQTLSGYICRKGKIRVTKTGVGKQ